MKLPKIATEFLLKSVLLLHFHLQSCMGQVWKKQIIEECAVCFEQTQKETE